MQINNSTCHNNQSFQAHYICKSKVKALKNGQYVDKFVNLVELDRLNNKDQSVLHGLVREWNSCISRGIYKVFVEYPPNSIDHVFALTTQKTGYDVLNSKDILALASVASSSFKDSMVLEYIQVNPQYIKDRKFKEGSLLQFLSDVIGLSMKTDSRPFKNVGSGFISSLMKFYKPKEIELVSLPEVVPFYKNLGFKRVGERDMPEMIWKSGDSLK